MVAGCGGGNAVVDTSPSGAPTPTQDTAPPITSDTGPGTMSHPIVVYWSIDTLSAPVATTIDLCARVQQTLAPAGLDVGCYDGAVPPSSRTLESHLRTLWPDRAVEGHRHEIAPPCDEVGTLGLLVDAFGAAYVVAPDNPHFTFPGDAILCDGEVSWFAGADASFGYDEGSVVAVVEEADRPVARGLDALEAAIADGQAAVALFNDYEAGGHTPRCFFAPQSAACTALWAFAVDEGLVDPDADPAEAWTDALLWNLLLGRLGALDDVALDAFRPGLLDTIVEQSDYFAEERLLPRLARLVDAVVAAGRQADLVLVLAGDHGENPCVTLPFGSGVQCSHGGAPTDWTGRVPVLVAPAEVGDAWRQAGLVGDGDQAWALGNVSHGLVHTFGLPTPDHWPDPEPLGSATSWACADSVDVLGGIRVEGDTALRCVEESCGAFRWATPTSALDTAEPVEDVPSGLLAYGDPNGPGDNWFTAACAD